MIRNAKGRKVSIPSDRTIKRRLKELRRQIDGSNDPAVQRISYAMECGIRWAREETAGWEAPAATATDLAKMLKREIAESERKMHIALAASLAEMLRLGATDNDATVGPNKVVRLVREALADRIEKGEA